MGVRHLSLSLSHAPGLTGVFDGQGGSESLELRRGQESYRGRLSPPATIGNSLIGMDVYDRTALLGGLQEDAGSHS